MSNEAVGAVFLSKNSGRMMLNLRSEHVTYPQYWGFVGGKLEESETAIAALKREISEELGDSVPPIVDIIPFDIFLSKNEKFKYYSFLVVVQDEFVPELNSESAGYAWVKIGSWPKPLHPGAKSTLYNQNLLQDFEHMWNALSSKKPFTNSLPQ